MMDNMILGFTQQLAEALEIGAKVEIVKSEKQINNVIVSGLGGSGIGGNLVQELIADKIKLPFLVNKDYFLPAFVNENTLVIISSYSGNTEETIAALNEAIKKKAQIVCVTSGGKIAEIARNKKLGLILVPEGKPPRTALGYSFIQQLYILNYFDLIDNFFKEEIRSSIELLDTIEEIMQQHAREIADKITNKSLIIYTTAGNEAIAVRFRQQVNENAKMLCSHHVIPEMNHNELVGWRKADENTAVIFFRNDNDFSRYKQRIEINKEIIRKYTKHILEIYSSGNTKLIRDMYMIHLGDWISFFLAENRNMDSVEVHVIDHLKEKLAKFED